MTFLEHLEELRWTLVRSAIAIAVGFVLAFVFKTFVFEDVVLAARDPHFITYRGFCKLGELLNMPGICISELGFTLQNLPVSGQFMTHMTVAFVAGFIIAFPYILWEIWRFIGPGLREKERKALRWFVFFGSFLFTLGVLFGYYMLAPLSVQFFGNYQVSPSVANNFALESFIGIITQVTLWTGLVFEMPLIVLVLSRLGIIGPAVLRQYRRHAYVGILLIAAILTPPDVISQLIVSGPLILLYESSIGISARVQRRMLRAARSPSSVG
ncbi:MAG: twin-arginine translocase subunit TatC [Flavobacteriales bacterium]|nr:twin-arginine translocase subunit TatC [Flavobacteriales bacterium]MCC6938469.1 twin-arginine translocase subunit TatC [Flavobacteriales bacterium]